MRWESGESELEPLGRAHTHTHKKMIRHNQEENEDKMIACDRDEKRGENVSYCTVIL